jgi:hypothetical protein
VKQDFIPEADFNWDELDLDKMAKGKKKAKKGAKEPTVIKN